MPKYLRHLRSNLYEHEEDRKALSQLQDFPFLSKAVNFVMNWTNVKWEQINYEGSVFQVTEDVCPELYNLLEDVAKTLDLDYMPRVFTEWSYLINAFTMGHNEDAMIVLNSGVVDLMTDDEVRFVVGHEMGHIKSGHVLYHQMVWNLTDILENIPFVDTLFKLRALYWYRMSEYTADRAGLLACQNIDVALSAMTKMAGLPLKYHKNISRDMILKQAKKFMDGHQDFQKKAMSEIAILDDNHPWLVLRAAELIKWYESDEYKSIINI